MKTITTRELLSNHKSVQSTLAGGESVVWKSRGKVIAELNPPPPDRDATLSRHNWLERARKTKAINRSSSEVSERLYEERG